MMLRVRILTQFEKPTVLQVGENGQKFHWKNGKKMAYATGSHTQYRAKEIICKELESDLEKWVNTEVFNKKIKEEKGGLKISQSVKTIDFDGNIGVFALLFGYMDTTNDISRIKPVAFSYLYPFHELLANMSPIEIRTVNNKGFSGITKVAVFTEDGKEISKEDVLAKYSDAENLSEITNTQLIVNDTGKHTVNGLFVEDIYINLDTLFKVSVDIYDKEQTKYRNKTINIHIQKDNLPKYFENGFKLVEERGDSYLVLADEDKKKTIIELLIKGIMRKSKETNNGTHTDKGSMVGLVVSDELQLVEDKFYFIPNHDEEVKGIGKYRLVEHPELDCVDVLFNQRFADQNHITTNKTAFNIQEQGEELLKKWFRKAGFNV